MSEIKGIMETEDKTIPVKMSVDWELDTVSIAIEDIDEKDMGTLKFSRDDVAELFENIVNPISYTGEELALMPKEDIEQMRKESIEDIAEMKKNPIADKIKETWGDE